jgi:hypothetical protein
MTYPYSEFSLIPYFKESVTSEQVLHKSEPVPNFLEDNVTVKGMTEKYLQGFIFTPEA